MLGAAPWVNPSIMFVVSIFCAACTLLLMYWAYGKPAKDYDSHDFDGTELEMHRHHVREMLRRCRTDDDVCDVVERAIALHQIPLHELEEILDQMRPLADPHDQAAWAVRREQLLGNH